jgi:hypothetical protein
MKNLILLLLTIIATGCATSLQNDSKDIVIEYSAITRGRNMNILVRQGSVSTTSTVGSKATTTAIVSAAQWNDVIAALDKVNLDKISGLKPPSDKRAYDGALIGNLKVTVKDKIYESSSFDHGNPPAEIAEVVNKVIALSTPDNKEE